MVLGNVAQARPHEAGRVIDDRYEVVRELGRGAMGVVVQVHDRLSNRDLALKQMLPRTGVTTGGRNDRAVVRFRREFHTIVGLSHPCVVAAYEYGFDEQQPYYTMELLEGPTLRELIGETAVQCCRVTRAVASALAFLHARRLLHRDLKARNVRCDAEGRPKLLDFGVLATMGVAGDVAGTPPCIPPEAMWGLPLDGRADLFGLGTLVYRLLTGRHAFPAETVDELEECWRHAPAPPSQYRTDVPVALDELVLAMLSIEPAGRPNTAAQIIARLDAIGGLEQAPELEVAQGWLRSARLVGRTEELRCVREAVEGAARGRGALLMVEGPSGVGKTRLLREAGLQAQLAGATVLRGRGRGWGHAPYDLVRQLARAMLRARPRDAERAGRAHKAVLGRVVPELGRGPRARRRAPGLVPAEERLQLQQALLEWFVGVAERRPLVMLVDDVERCDDGSASLLAALGHVASGVGLVVVAAARIDGLTPAPSRVQGAQRLRLTALDRAAVAELVQDWFGDLPDAALVVDWIHGAAGGSPLHCSELARHLAEDGVVAYGEGSWRLMFDPGEGRIPQRMAEAMDRRVEDLSAVGRWLGQALAVWRGPASVELCAELLDTDELTLVFEALDELVFEEIIVGGDEGFDLSHDGVREALIRCLDDEQRQALHERAAELIVMRWGPHGGERQADLGRHLLAAGQHREGAQQLELAGRRHYELRSFSDAIGLLRDALRVYRTCGDPRDEPRCLELQALLMRAGVIGDRSVVLAHADETLDAYERYGGLPLARRLSPWVGRRIAVGVGLGVAYLRWWAGRARRTGVSPRESLKATVALAGYAAVVHAMAFDFEHVRAIGQRLDPIRAVRAATARAALAMLDGLDALGHGRWNEAHDRMAEVATLAETPGLGTDAEMDPRMFRGGALVVQALLGAVQQQPSFSTAVAALESMRMRFSMLGAEMNRVYFHRLRGEEMRARRLSSESELSVVQLGRSWAGDSIGAWVGALAYGITGDTAGLREVLDQLQPQATADGALVPFATLARAELARHEGDPVRARDLLREALHTLPADQLLLQLALRSALVEALLDGDASRDAVALAEQTLQDAPPGTGPRPSRIRLRCALARGLARQREHERAAGLIAALVTDCASIDSPLLVGLIHEAGCEVAGAADASTEQRHHAARAELLFVSTANPVLVARARRLVGSVSTKESGVLRAGVSEGLDTVDLEPLSSDSGEALPS
ncbi:MAG: AAA family ATPase [Deltaproteobacteria bacterium]|nr:AAA family ATPase [Deltaproteobacteria bacterium]